MTKEVAEFLLKVVEYSGRQEAKILSDYSGRGMYGKTTYALDIESPTMLLGEVLEYFGNNLEELEDDKGNLTTVYTGEAMPPLGRATKFATDNLGLNYVIY
jgi:hypothetical protein